MAWGTLFSAGFQDEGNYRTFAASGKTGARWSHISVRTLDSSALRKKAKKSGGKPAFLTTS
jgi:hypothetical protein